MKELAPGPPVSAYFEEVLCSSRELSKKLRVWLSCWVLMTQGMIFMVPHNSSLPVL